MSPYAITILLFLASTSIATAQVNIKGVFLEDVKSFESGDTAVFYGAREDSQSKRLYYFLKSNGHQVVSTKVRLLTDEIGFWELQQFYYLSRKITESGWQTQKRDELNSMTLDYLARLETDSKIYTDRFAEDFLQQTIQKIHYPKFNKGKDYYLSIKIVNSERKFVYAFDNGALLISTQLLAESKSYDEILQLLSRAVAHILLNSNIENLHVSSTSELEELGAIYTEGERKKIRLITDNFIKHSNRTKPGSLDPEPGQYMASIAGVISYTAWQAFYNKEYSRALEYITRLEEHKLTNSTDLLLKAKCYMEISNTEESNLSAHGMLLLATTFRDEYLPEIYSELGLVLLRLKRYNEAKTAYMKYQEFLSCTDKTEQKTWTRKMIHACNYYIEKEEENAVVEVEIPVESAPADEPAPSLEERTSTPQSEQNDSTSVVNPG